MAGFKCTPANKKRIVDCYARGGSLAICAGVVGVNQNTITEWIKADPDFADDLACARAKKADDYLQKLDTAEHRDARQMRWWLGAMFQREYGTTQKIELTGADGGPIQVQSLAAVVVRDDRARDAYQTLLGSFTRAIGDGKPGGAAHDLEQGQPDAVAALPAQSKARQRASRRGAAVGKQRPADPDQLPTSAARKDGARERRNGDVVPR